MVAGGGDPTGPLGAGVFIRLLLSLVRHRVVRECANEERET